MNDYAEMQLCVVKLYQEDLRAASARRRFARRAAQPARCGDVGWLPRHVRAKA